MNWSNVKMIFQREVRDQLRDRRTLFMIAVLPIFLYPLLGMSFFQIAQFLREQPTRVLVSGLPKLDDFPPLVDGDRFAAEWLADPQQARLFQLSFAAEDAAGEESSEQVAERCREAVQHDQYEAIVVFPPDFATQLQRFRTQLMDRTAESGQLVATAPSVPRPAIYYSTANEKSQLAFDRVSNILRGWSEAIGQQNLKDSQLPLAVAHPFELERQDVSEITQRNAALWSKILPFVLLVWALTGAFYPAVDLCAGEKERGTLETLLSSPAKRSEIVTGKLLTVMLFSMATSVLNLVSMGITGALVISHLGGDDPARAVGLPPILTSIWLLIALVPVAALFSALCLALAAFARSSKEGQYYLMPLVLVTLPLVILPMGPGMELNLGNSLIPLTGLVLLLRSLLEGNYLPALPYIAPVVGMTLLCCLLAVRWAVEQFNKESVLFRESERLDVTLWIRHLLRDRGDTPSIAEAIFCGVLILLIRFFMGFALPMPQSFAEFAVVAVVTQLVMIATPAVLMAVMLTRSPRKTLLLRLPRWWTLPAAAALAVALHPAAKLLQVVVEQLYPTSQGVKDALNSALSGSIGWCPAILVIALAPAICEELAFRGFILSGFRHLRSKWRAIAFSSLMFGMTHTVLQQSIVTCIIGAVIAYVAIQTGSILPAVTFHFTHNSLMLVAGELHESAGFAKFIQPIADGTDFIYSWWLFDFGLIAAGVLLLRFAALTRPKPEIAESPIASAIQTAAAVSGSNAGLPCGG